MAPAKKTAARRDPLTGDDWQLHQVVFGCADHADADVCVYLVPTDAAIERLGSRPDRDRSQPETLHLPARRE
jgi:hypothetical protein